MSDAGGALVLFDIDTQVDFMYPEGKLHVPGAEQIVPKLEILMNWARANDIPVVSTADAHQADDPEFKIWPPHCVVGTDGQHRIPETLFPMPTAIPARPGAFKRPSRWRGQYIVEKSTYTPEDNPNFAALLGALGSRRAVVCGVATEFCVRAVVLALCKRGFEVDVVTDAIKSITDEGGRSALAEMSSAGARMVTIATVCDRARADTETP